MGLLTKKYDFQTIELRKTNKKLLLTALLNIIDGILTYIGVTNNYIKEINFLMVKIVSDINKLIIVKLLIPTTFFLIVYYLINKYNFCKMTIARAFINLCFYAYLFVLLTHLVWLSLLVYTKIK